MFWNIHTNEIYIYIKRERESFIFMYFIWNIIAYENTGWYIHARFKNYDENYFYS